MENIKIVNIQCKRKMSRFEFETQCFSASLKSKEEKSQLEKEERKKFEQKRRSHIHTQSHIKGSTKQCRWYGFELKTFHLKIRLHHWVIPKAEEKVGLFLYSCGHERII